MADLTKNKEIYYPFSGEEFKTYSGLVNESCNFFGIPVYYLVRSEGNLDELFGEDPIATIGTEKYYMKMYFANPGAWQGQGDLFTKMGFQVTDEIELVIGQDYFKQYLKKSALRTAPAIGDIIYLKWAKKYFEITFVEHEDTFYHLGEEVAWKISCKAWVYSHEEMDTNISDIDSVEPVDGAGDVVIDDYSDNTLIDTEDDDIINDDETNPLGSIKQ